MDKLTLVTLAINQPRRATIFSEGPGDPKPWIECAQCALTYLDHEVEAGRGDVYAQFVLSKTDLMLVAPAAPAACKACGLHLEYA